MASGPRDLDLEMVVVRGERAELVGRCTEGGHVRSGCPVAIDKGRGSTHGQVVSRRQVRGEPIEVGSIRRSDQAKRRCSARSAR